MDLLTTEDSHSQKEETWNAVDRERQEQENADWKKKTLWIRLKAQVLLVRSNCI